MPRKRFTPEWHRIPMPRNNRYFPEEHREIFIELIRSVLKLGKGLDLRIIVNSEAKQLSQLISKEAGGSISSKQLQKYAKETSGDYKQIVRLRPGTLNLLSKFVLKKIYAADEFQKLDPNLYWIEFINYQNHKVIHVETVNDLVEVDNGNTLAVQVRQKQTVTFTRIPSDTLKMEIEKWKAYYDMTVISKLDIPTINRIHVKASLIGGGLAGLTNAMLLIFLPPTISGFAIGEGSNKPYYTGLVTGANFLCGCISGYLICGLFGRPTLYDQVPRVSFRHKLIISMIASTIMIFFFQLGSRKSVEDHILDTVLDLETLTYCITGSIGIIDTVKLFRGHFIVPRRVLFEDITITTFKVLCVLSVICVASLFLRGNVVPGLSTSHFKFDYSDPQRIVVVGVMNFLNMLTWVAVRNAYYKSQLGG